MQVSGRYLLQLSCLETKERQLFYCFVWITLGIFRYERFSHFLSFSHVCAFYRVPDVPIKVLSFLCVTQISTAS